tara:strand:+ start:319 stop:564 length:246 start_codon:yes stop_codon:yes gene_type:complete
MLPLELIIRALGIVFSLGILAFAIVLGGVIFISLAGVVVLIMIGLYIRSFFYRRKQDSGKGSDETVIDAEYTILDNKDSDD